eukprot:IDg3173t1
MTNFKILASLLIAFSCLLSAHGRRPFAVFDDNDDGRKLCGEVGKYIITQGGHIYFIVSRDYISKVGYYPLPGYHQMRFSSHRPPTPSNGKPRPPAPK